MYLEEFFMYLSNRYNFKRFVSSFWHWKSSWSPLRIARHTQEWFYIFARIYFKTYHWRYYQTFLIMHPLEVYYLTQAGRGSEIGPIYSTPPFVQRGHGIGNFFGTLFRSVKPIIWSGAKAHGRKSLRIGDKIFAFFHPSGKTSIFKQLL